MRTLQAHCHAGLGMLHLDSGDSDACREQLLEAANMYREIGAQSWLGKVESVLKTF